MRYRETAARKHGFVLVAVALSLIGLIASLGLAYDLGRVYIARSEGQNFTDAAAIAAALELDGTQQGITRARQRVANDLNRWNFANNTFSNAVTEFATTANGPWVQNPVTPVGYGHARVLATMPVPLTFLPMIEPVNVVPGAGMVMMRIGSTMNIKANSDAGQIDTISYDDGLLPFSPYAHLYRATTANPSGMMVGEQYTLRWAASFNSNGNNDDRICPGDRVDILRELARSGQASDRGYIEETSASVIRQAIVFDYQTVFRTIGDPVNMTGGTKQTQVDALRERISQDGDTVSRYWSAYVAEQNEDDTDSIKGNGRRLVGVPINDGHPTYRIVEIGAFFLLEASEYQNGGNKPFCAEYVGAWVKGSRNKGAEENGAYTLKLTR